MDLGSDARNYNSDLNVEELTRRAKIFCWNCHHDACIGTLIVEENPVFCYGCGAANIYKPDCETCHPGNLIRSEGCRTSLREDPSSTDH